jgi:2-haloacid dehalogenase
MSFALYLFDADHTLFDFDLSEKQAFAHALRELGIEREPAPLLAEYKSISQKLWLLFENGGITKDELKVRRYSELFDKHGLIQSAEKMSELYLEALPKHPYLYQGAVEVVRKLASNARIGIVTNGIEIVQRRRLGASELTTLIEQMIVSEECGFAKPDARIFDYTLEKFAHGDRSSVLMIGDRIDTDIEGARRAGIKGCWYNPERKEHLGTKPDFEIHALEQLLKL